MISLVNHIRLIDNIAQCIFTAKYLKLVAVYLKNSLLLRTKIIMKIKIVIKEYKTHNYLVIFMVFIEILQLCYTCVVFRIKSSKLLLFINVKIKITISRGWCMFIISVQFQFKHIFLYFKYCR